MAFPDEFRFSSEENFIRRFMIPLLQRLGYSLVVHFHGDREFGKDLIFADIDRFGHFRYYGLQAKYQSNISLNGVEDLIQDCHQAFANPFTHPQTGTTHRICGFYAVNGGSLGDAAVTHYFNSLQPRFGGNVYLLQGKDLRLLDRWACADRSSFIKEQLSGMLLEVRYNRLVLGESEKNVVANQSLLLRLKLDAISQYLTTPTLGPMLNNATILKYWRFASTCNSLFDRMGTPWWRPTEEGTKVLASEFLPALHELSGTIENAILVTLTALSPLALGAVDSQSTPDAAI